MTRHAEIVALYEAKEADAGGLAHADPKAILHQIAAETDIPFAEVRQALIDHWACQGVG